MIDVINNYMKFPYKFALKEIERITNELTEKDKSLLVNSKNTLNFYLSQLKYPSIRRIDNNNLLFIGSIDEFIIDNDTHQFYIKEYEYEGNYIDVSEEDFKDIYNKIFHAAYLPKTLDDILNNNINFDVVDVSDIERACYKLLSVIEKYYGVNIIMYALDEYLDDHTKQYIASLKQNNTSKDDNNEDINNNIDDEEGDDEYNYNNSSEDN